MNLKPPSQPLYGLQHLRYGIACVAVLYKCTKNFKPQMQILLLTAFGMDQEFASPTLVSLISKRLGLGWIIGILDDFAIFLFTIVVIAQVLA